ncbi:MAG: thrombospondin type 3 repeat-containing protein [Dehalococcoidia bacterium]|nr:thrombospondin type 3 repeat-containing protein [Dehalococcoidia bacterium]
MTAVRSFATLVLTLVVLLLAGGSPAGAATATITVNSTGDTNARDGVLTLREAMLLATGGLTVGTLDSGECAQVSASTYTPPCSTTDSIGAASADTIAVPAGTITLAAVLPTLSTGNDTISGAGPASSIVDGVTKTFNCFLISGESSDNNKISGLQIKRCADGVRIELGADANTIGGTTAGERNVISDNNVGVRIDGSATTGNAVSGNYMGTDVTGTLDLGNTGDGVWISDAPSNTIGGTAASARNVISGNDIDGVRISGTAASGNLVQGNYLGTDVSGTLDVGNTWDGVLISGAPSNTIGGTAAGARNVISGNNSNGVFINGAGATGNLVQGNFIGTDVTGTLDVGNSANGVDISLAPSNTVGGTAAGARNVISGNNQSGIRIGDAGATGNLVQGNFIGTDVTGALDLGNNNSGVLINDVPTNTIGGTAAGARNVISGNDSNGVEIRFAGATGNLVQGNYIGTDVTGSLDLGNTSHGVMINGAPSNTIGGTAAGARNVISGNNLDGVMITEAGATGNLVQGNYIGTKSDGVGALGNTLDGVFSAAPGNTIGGTTPSARNVISGNDVNGVVIAGATGNLVQRNYIGTDVTGALDVGNTFDGVLITGSSNTIGGTTAGARNVISGNDSNGVEIRFAGATGNLVQGNYIGTDVTGSLDLGNTSHGVMINGAPSNTIGGTAAGARNTIAFNGGDGVFADPTAGTGNAIDPNSIHSNTGLGIDLGVDGVTANDLNDPDVGANNLQNFPVVTSALCCGAGGTVITGSLNSTAGTMFALEFFTNPACDPSGNGEGQSFLGSASVTTVNNDAAISVTVGPAAIGSFVTATATDPANNTSEFSACRIVQLDTDGDGTPDSNDNCPLAPNTGQYNLVHPLTPAGDACENPDHDPWVDAVDNCPDVGTPWVVPLDDNPDCDGFPRTTQQGARGPESFIGTDPDVACGVNAWPVDINDNLKAELSDILAYIPVFGTTAPPPPSAYNPRFDLNADNKVGLQDILMFIPFFGYTCTP